MEKFKLSDQALGAIMMAVQTSLVKAAQGADDCDITEMLRSLKLVNTDDGLVVENPPFMEINNENLGG